MSADAAHIVVVSTTLRPSELGPFLARLEADHKFNCEHVVRQSWFGAAKPMRSDLHHLFTCDPGCNSFPLQHPLLGLPRLPKKLYAPTVGATQTGSSANPTPITAPSPGPPSTS